MMKQKQMRYGLLVLGALLFSSSAFAENTLRNISFTSLPGDRVQLRLELDSPAKEPGSFTIDNPARIALDFPETKSGLEKKTVNIGVGVANSVTAVEASGRTRVVVNLAKLVGYKTSVEGNTVIVSIENAGTSSAKATVATGRSKAGTAMGGISNVDFRRGNKGEGRLIVTLTDPNTPVDMSKRGNEVVLTLQNVSLPKNLERRLDVMDFATPVRTVDAFQNGADVRMVLNNEGEFDHIAYQTDDKFTVDIKPITKEKAEETRKKFAFKGERLSLNFQNIEVRAVLQLIADFTGLNMVTSDAVSGSLTLRLKNVPWDQALDIILKTKGLAKREAGNVLMIGPASEIAAQEKVEFEAARQNSELAPLRSETIQVNYAKASELAGLIKSGDAKSKSSLLSERGSLSIDQRTNKLLIQDTSDRIEQIRSLVAELDIPIRQVLIESRIVIANDNFSKQLGVKFGVSGVQQTTDGALAYGGTQNSVDTTITSARDNIVNNGNPFPVGLPAGAPSNDRMNTNLPVIGPMGTLALAVLGANSLVDLELSALQAEGKGKIVSNPRVVTANGHQALIEQGVEIPYQEASSSGATSVSFKKAVLSLKVNPQITPDNRVIMDLAVNKDSVGQVYAGIPSIDTREVQTQVLVNNGETVVLGGVYEHTVTNEVDRVPFFGDLPLLGALFRQTRESNQKSELLIFITPKILKDSKVY